VEYYGKVGMDDNIKKVEDLIQLKINNGYYELLPMLSTEEINGYKLYDIKGRQLMNWRTYESFKKIWEEEKCTTYEEFKAEFTQIACTDWYKQDRHGECFGGFWKYPEGSPEKENAFQLSFDDNCLGLFELPYPKAAILYTVTLGCSNRMESVRYSNFICEWFTRKTKQLAEYEKRQKEIIIVSGPSLNEQWKKQISDLNAKIEK